MGAEGQDRSSDALECLVYLPCGAGPTYLNLLTWLVVLLCVENLAGP
jgi:hypothetical protein